MVEINQSLKPVQTTPYLSVCPDRRPKQKVHTTLGHAKNAVIYRDQWSKGIPEDCAIYEWRDGDWQLLYEIPRGTRSRNMPWHNKED